MKSHIIVLCWFTCRISAYYYESRETRPSVKDTFEILVSDVDSDVKDSIDCTLLNMDHFFDFTAAESYRRLCKDEPLTDFTYYKQQQPLNIDISSVNLILPSESIKNSEIADSELSRDINNAKSDVNNTIIEFLSKYSNMRGYSGDEIKVEFKNDRLKENIDSLSQNAQGNLFLEMLLKNNTNINSELCKILDEILNKLNKTYAMPNSTDNIKFIEFFQFITKDGNKTYEDVEKVLSELKSLEIKNLDDIKSLLEKEHNYQNIPIRNYSDFVDTSKNSEDKNSSSNKILSPTLFRKMLVPEQLKYINISATPNSLSAAQISKVGENNTKINNISNTAKIFTINNNSINFEQSTEKSTTELLDINIANTSPNKINNTSTTVLIPKITTKTTSVPVDTSALTTKETTPSYEKFSTNRMFSTTSAPTVLTTNKFIINPKNSDTLKEYVNYDYFFNFNEEDTKDAISSAENLIKESKKSQSIFDKLFKI